MQDSALLIIWRDNAKSIKENSRILVKNIKNKNIFDCIYFSKVIHGRTEFIFDQVIPLIDFIHYLKLLL